MSSYSEQHQHHTGPGDNIGRDKIVNTSVSPEQIKDNVLAIYSKRRNGDIEGANERLESLMATAELNAESRSILHSASCTFKAAKGEELEKESLSIILRDLRSSESAFCTDIHCSSLIRVYCKNDQVKEAKELYHSISLGCELTNEAYFEIVADEEEIEAYFNAKKSLLLEGELCGLLIGLIRQESKNFQLIKSISERLCVVATSYNSEYLKFVSKAYSHTVHHEGTPYWKLKAEARNKLLFFCDTASELLEQCKGKDKRLLRSAVQLINIVQGEHESLLNTSWKFVELFEGDHPDFTSRLRQLYGHDDQRHSELSSLQRIAIDPGYKKNKLKEFAETASIEPPDAYVLSKIGGPTLIKDWIEKGGVVEAESKLERDFALLELKVKAYSTSQKAYQILKQTVEDFITNNQQNLDSIYPDRLVDVAVVLVDCDLANEAVAMLQPHISDSDLWSSRLTRCYLNALLESNQHLTLADTIAKFSSEERDHFVCQIHAKLHALHRDNKQAISCLEECVDNEPLATSAWANLISLYIEEEVEKEKIQNTLSKVPLGILKKPSFHTYRLLGQHSLFGSFELAEKTLIEWFISNPEECAMDFTNFHFSIMIENGINPQLSDKSEYCLGGVVYKKNNQQTVTKIIVTDDAIQHPDFITESSPLGSELLNMEPSEITQLGMLKIELIEKLPPFVACLRVAMKLREELNDGTDCFHSLSLPDDPEEMLETLKEHMSFEGPERQREADPSIPLYLKGPIGEGGGSSSQAVNHVLDLFTSKLVPKGKPSSLGEKEPNKVVLDIYGVVYISLIGASEELLNITNITITLETHQLLEDWLQSICDEDYLTLGVSAEGLLIRNTFDDIQAKTQSIQAQVRRLLEASQIESPSLVDMPTQFALMRTVLNKSVASSIRLAISNEISWFCMDHTFAQLALELGAPPVNVEDLLRMICQQMSTEDKRSAIYLHVQTELPLNITFNDLRELAICEDEYSHYFLSELIRKYPESYENSIHALSFLSDIATKAIAQSFIEGAILDGLSYRNPTCKYYTERLVNTCMYTYACLGQEDTFEKRIAALLFNVFTAFEKLERARQIVSQIAFRFIQGHFLDLDSVNENLKSMYAHRVSR